ncbi:uncharacterized protein LAESUDRAFT_723863 [Laetiporus sulphureus 93-53]|uniref:C2H2-type domain-containing protein n=1 Tax=Laetiporus sulphureus 93-53 TaxID=1314785 RepID=A0A165F4D8_9APHY|nr:uncharacterized protein LAESUDRAFT_723863 [Laetiporus sulphureus 93-53]KZT08361.1 hypothetical protein LAESUDRAFT_723863 [Laetiporus sulphureus 93-53]
MEVVASRTAASSVLVSPPPQHSFASYRFSSSAHSVRSPGMSRGSANPQSDFADRPHAAEGDATFYATASAGHTHAASSYLSLAPYPGSLSSHLHPSRSETWPPTRIPASSSNTQRPVLPPLNTLLAVTGRDARTISPETPRPSPSSVVHLHPHSLTPALPPLSNPHGSALAGSPASSTMLPRLPPIMQVEKQQVTTSATQAASASRRRNEAHFVCPVPGCGSTFTRRFNLRGHLRSHTAERPFMCEWPGCNKGFARQHDCKRHQALHTAKSQTNVCGGCGKTFSRLDALNRHLRSENGAECRETAEAAAAAARLSPSDDMDDWENRSASSDRSGR